MSLAPRFFIGLSLCAALASCSLVPSRPGQPGTGAVAANAAALGAALATLPASIRVDPEDASGALTSFSASCNFALRREDASGLTRISDWEAPCRDAANWPREQATAFFGRHFRPVRVGDGKAYATGYFEPEIRGSRTRRPGYEVPVYAVPGDLVRCWREGTSVAEQTGNPPFSRRTATGACVPYYDRAEIEQGALAGRGLEIAWAADPVEFFFLQIQGSGRLRTPEGEIIRIGYAGQNGHSYTGIGGLMRERGLLGSGAGQYAGSMQGIMQYIRENPRDGAALMRENRSWVFFRVQEGDGPLGSLGVPVRGASSVAVDPRFVPYGAPVLLTTDRNEANGLWVAQDTGGAIKGANRFDTFWGAGEQARATAGGMSARGEALILLPKAAADRLPR